ncbi:MAG: type II toxin-antitoxin system RelE/ParE family toxin [Paludibacter sp.]|jgi:toxin ParE1/3/4
MLSYELTLKAVDDLTEIWNYTCDVWSEKQADIYYELLVDSFNELTKNPYIGKKYTAINENIYGLLTGKHILFYRIDVGKIVVVRILHQQMDIKNKI